MVSLEPSRASTRPSPGEEQRDRCITTLSHRPRNCAPSGRCCFRPQRWFDRGRRRARQWPRSSSSPVVVARRKTIPCFSRRRAHSRGVPSAAPQSSRSEVPDKSSLEYPRCLSPCLDSRLYQFPAPETWRVPDEVVIYALAMLDFFVPRLRRLAGTCLGEEGPVSMWLLLRRLDSPAVLTFFTRPNLPPPPRHPALYCTSEPPNDASSLLDVLVPSCRTNKQPPVSREPVSLSQFDSSRPSSSAGGLEGRIPPVQCPDARDVRPG
jgi:hypothetical protein